MGVSLTSIKCPACGAMLDIEDGRKQVFCSYCGTKILVNNDNEYIYHHVDDADIKQAETDRIIQMRKMDLIEKECEERERTKREKGIVKTVVAFLAIVFIIIGNCAWNDGLIFAGILCCFILLFMWINDRKKPDELDFGDKVMVPSSISGYKNKNYEAIEAIFRSAGFTNVKSIPLNDLTAGLLKKPGMVESIIINGQSVTGGGTKYMPNVSVIISYHSYK